MTVAMLVRSIVSVLSFRLGVALLLMCRSWCELKTSREHLLTGLLCVRVVNVMQSVDTTASLSATHNYVQAECGER